MNFFGHAAVASWTTSDPAFVLGTMIPDFANMIGERAPRFTPGALCDGIAFHHETDRVFHRTQNFVRLERAARRSLSNRGVRRGTTLAVAHVGVELLLDAELAKDDGHRRAYVAALGAAARSDTKKLLNLRYRTLCRMLRWRGVSPAPVDPHQMARRLGRALEHRPRMRILSEQMSSVAAWVENAAPLVEAALPGLVEELRLGLLAVEPPAPLRSLP